MADLTPTTDIQAFLAATDKAEARTMLGVPTAISLGMATAGNSLSTEFTGTNNDLKFTQIVDGYPVSIALDGIGAGVSSVIVDGRHIRILVESTSDTSDLTANEIIGLVQASSAAMALITIENAPGNDGTEPPQGNTAGVPYSEPLGFPYTELNYIGVFPNAEGGGDLVSGPVTSTAGVSSIADAALTPAKVAGTALVATDASATGGADKVLKLDGSGNLTLGVLASGAGSVRVPDMQRYGWKKRDGTDAGAYLLMEEQHDIYGGEMHIVSPWRIALLPTGPIQVGRNDSGRYVRKMQLVSGYASAADAVVNYMPSGALAFQTSAWNGSANVQNEIIFQAKALDTTGTNSILELWDQARVTGQDGGEGGVFTAGRAETTGNKIARFYKEGIWSPGTAPSYTVLTSGSVVSQTCSIYKTTQSARVTLAHNATLSIAGAVDGMRGVIYVTQDATGSRTLTPDGGAALGLSTTAGDTDRVTWDFDGTYLNFLVTQDVQRELVGLDADAVTFFAAASISDAGQKAAVNELVLGLKAASLWTRFYALYPFVGGNATAHSKDLKNTYPITWAGGTPPTHGANGVAATGAGYGNTFINLSTLSAQNSASGYVYCRTELPTPTDLGYMFGNASGGTRFGLGRGGSQLGAFGPNDNSVVTLAVAASSDFRKHLAVNRSGASATSIYANGTRITGTTASVAAANGNIFLFARNDATGAGASPSSYVSAEFAFFAVGQSLSESEWTTFRGLIDTYQTALGRAN